MTKQRPFALHDRSGIAVMTFATYAAAERTAIKWCLDKKSGVPIYRGRTRLAEVRPCADRRYSIDMTIAGSAIA